MPKYASAAVKEMAKLQAHAGRFLEACRGQTDPHDFAIAPGSRVFQVDRKFHHGPDWWRFWQGNEDAAKGNIPLRLIFFVELAS